MVNLLGSAAGPARPDTAAALAVEGAHLHLYDKAEVRPGRKMGHVTALAGDPATALGIARRAAAAVAL
jgi:5-(carboxyamino)imidazole ribonucleotide synthase